LAFDELSKVPAVNGSGVGIKWAQAPFDCGRVPLPGKGVARIPKSRQLFSRGLTVGVRLVDVRGGKEKESPTGPRMGAMGGWCLLDVLL